MIKRIIYGITLSFFGVGAFAQTNWKEVQARAVWAKNKVVSAYSSPYGKKLENNIKEQIRKITSD